MSQRGREGKGDGGKEGLKGGMVTPNEYIKYCFYAFQRLYQFAFFPFFLNIRNHIVDDVRPKVKILEAAKYYAIFPKKSEPLIGFLLVASKISAFDLKMMK